MDIITHYDMLVDENNDPFRDPPLLQENMDQWDGQIFLEFLKLDKKKRVLEIGIGMFGDEKFESFNEWMSLQKRCLFPKDFLVESNIE